MAKVVFRNGKWICDHRTGGKRRKPSFATRSAAEEFKRELLLRQQGLVLGADALKPMSIADSIREYAKTSIKSAEDKGMEKKWFERLYDFLLDEKKLFWMHEVRLIHLEEFQAKQRSRVAAATVNRYFNTYNNFFNKCERWKVVSRSPATGLQRLPENPQERKIWTAQQMENILSEIPGWAGDILYFLAGTSVRPGREVQRIIWGHIDFPNATCRITTFKGNGEARVRYIPLTDNLLHFLQSKREAARRVFRGRDEDPVFVNSIGNTVESDVLDRIIRDACAKFGYQGLVPYGIRHTVYSEMVAKNVSLEKIRRLAGHSKLTTTQKYLKTNVSQLREALEDTGSGKLVRMVPSGPEVEMTPPPFETTGLEKGVK